MIKDRSKKILYITNHNPFGNSYGAEQRSNVLMNAALSNDYLVDIAYISPTDSQPPTVANNKSFIKLWGYKLTYKSSFFRNFLLFYGLDFLIPDHRLQTKIDTIIKENSYDYIMCRYINCAQKAGLWKYRNKLILDIDDLPIEKLMSRLEKENKHKTLNKFLKGPISFVLKHIIKRWIKHSYATFLPNEELANKWHTGFLPNIPIMHVDKPEYVNSQIILFVGLLNYRPNYQAIDCFVDNVLPLIVAKNKDVHLLVAGKELPRDIADKWQNNSNVTELGFVDDLYAFYNSGNIVICPIEEGSGTNIKVIEAMAMGKACVMTKFCVKGFENVIDNGINAYVVNDNSEFAEKVTSLLEDKGLCSEIMINAHAKACEYYSQDTINKILETVLK